MSPIFNVKSNLMLKLKDLFLASLYSLRKLNLLVGYCPLARNT